MKANNRIGKAAGKAASKAPAKAKAAGAAPGKAALLGLAFDAEDGHKRITKGDNFVLLGGSQETHAVMQETAIKVNEQLSDRGKRLEDVSPNELRDILHEVWK